jgi:hypothetical protein
VLSGGMRPGRFGVGWFRRTPGCGCQPDHLVRERGQRPSCASSRWGRTGDGTEQGASSPTSSFLVAPTSRLAQGVVETPSTERCFVLSIVDVLTETLSAMSSCVASRSARGGSASAQFFVRGPYHWIIFRRDRSSMVSVTLKEALMKSCAAWRLLCSPRPRVSTWPSSMFTPWSKPTSQRFVGVTAPNRPQHDHRTGAPLADRARAPLSHS